MLFFSCPLASLMPQKRLLYRFKDGKSPVEWAVAPKSINNLASFPEGVESKHR